MPIFNHGTRLLCSTNQQAQDNIVFYHYAKKHGNISTSEYFKCEILTTTNAQDCVAMVLYKSLLLCLNLSFKLSNYLQMISRNLKHSIFHSSVSLLSMS